MNQSHEYRGVNEYKEVRIKCHAKLVSAPDKINKLRDPEINLG